AHAAAGRAALRGDGALTDPRQAAGRHRPSPFRASRPPPAGLIFPSCSALPRFAALHPTPQEVPVRPPLAVPIVLTLAAWSTISAGAPHLTVVRVGDGSAALTNSATAVFLDEIDSTGTVVGTTALPTAVAGSNARLTLSGNATSEGAL